MSQKWVVFIVFTWIVIALAGGILDGSFMTDNQSAVLNKVLSFGIINSEMDSGTTFLNYVVAPFVFIGGLWDMATLNYDWMKGDYEIVRWLIVAPLLAGTVWGFILSFVGSVQKQT
jgi:hypothetical protein